MKMNASRDFEGIGASFRDRSSRITGASQKSTLDRDFYNEKKETKLTFPALEYPHKKN